MENNTVKLNNKIKVDESKTDVGGEGSCWTKLFGAGEGLEDWELEYFQALPLEDLKYNLKFAQGAADFDNSWIMYIMTNASTLHIEEVAVTMPDRPATKPINKPQHKTVTMNEFLELPIFYELKICGITIERLTIKVAGLQVKTSVLQQLATEMAMDDSDILKKSQMLATFANHDLDIIKLSLNRTKRYIVHPPVNLEIAVCNKLTQSMGLVTISARGRGLSWWPEYTYSLAVQITEILACTADKKVQIYMDHYVTEHLSETLPSWTIFDPDLIQDVVIIEAAFDDNHAMAFGKCLANATPEIIILMPELETCSEYTVQQAQSVLFIEPNDHGMSLCLQPGYTTLTDYKYVQANGLMYAITIDKNSTLIDAIHLHLIKHDNIDLTLTLLERKKDTMKVTVPVINTDGLVNALGSNLEAKLITIDNDLLRNLLIRNITGDVSVDELTDYGLAIAHSRYNLKDFQINNFSLTATKVLDTVYLAYLISNQVNKNSQIVVDYLSQHPLLSKLYYGLSTVLVNCVHLGLNKTMGDAMSAIKSLDQLTIGKIQDSDFTQSYADLYKELGNITRLQQTVMNFNVMNAYGRLNYQQPPLFGATNDQPGEYENTIEFNDELDTRDENTLHDMNTKSLNSNKPQLSVYKNSSGIWVRKPKMTVPATTSDTLHAHKCGACSKWYQHDHKYNSLQHPEFVGDCPWCESKMDNSLRSTRITWNIESDLRNENENFTKQSQIQTQKEDIGEETKAINLPTFAEKISSLPEPTKLHDEQFSATIANVESFATVATNTATVKHKKELLPYVQFKAAKNGQAKILNLPIGVIHAEAEYTCEHVMIESEDDCGKISVDYLMEPYGIGIEIDYKLFKPLMSYNDMVAVLMKSNTNFIVLHEKQVTIIKHHAIPIYSTLTLLKTPVDHTWHWAPSTIKTFNMRYFKLLSEQVYLSDITRQMQYAHLTHDLSTSSWHPTEINTLNNKLQNFEKASVDLEQINNFSIFVNGQSKVVLTNNEHHMNQIERGTVHIELPGSTSDFIKLINSLDVTDLRHEIFTTKAEIPKELPDNLHVYIKENVRQAICNYLLIKLWTPSLSRTVKVFNHPVQGIRINNGYLITKIPLGIKLKTMDHVTINNKNTTPIVVTRNGHIYIPNADYVGTNFDLGVFAISTSSVIRRLSYLQHVPLNITSAIQTLHEAQLIIGPGGSGKTTQALNTCAQGTVYLASTSGAQNAARLIARTMKTFEVLSVERFLCNPWQVKTLIIDEASLLDVHTATILCAFSKNVTFLGDPFQIPYQSMDFLPNEANIPGLLKVKSPTQQISTIYRYGQSLVDVINQVNKSNYSSESPHTTEIIMRTTQSWDLLQIIQTIVNTLDKENAIVLCFYKRHKNTLIDELKKIGSKIKVDTVHSWQGNQADQVFVLQCGYNLHLGGTAGIEIDPQYCLSAATRCREKLIWYTIRAYGEKATLSERLAGQKLGAGWYHTEYELSSNELTMPGSHEPIVEKEAFKFKYTPCNTGISDVKELKRHIIQQENLHGVKIDYIPGTARDAINIKYFNVVIITLSWDKSKKARVDYDKMNMVSDADLKELEKNIVIAQAPDLYSIKSINDEDVTTLYNLCAAIKSIQGHKPLLWNGLTISVETNQLVITDAEAIYTYNIVANHCVLSCSIPEKLYNVQSKANIFTDIIPDLYLPLLDVQMLNSKIAKLFNMCELKMVYHLECDDVSKILLTSETQPYIDAYLDVMKKKFFEKLLNMWNNGSTGGESFVGLTLPLEMHGALNTVVVDYISKKIAQEALNDAVKPQEVLELPASTPRYIKSALIEQLPFMAISTKIGYNYDRMDSAIITQTLAQIQKNVGYNIELIAPSPHIVALLGADFIRCRKIDSYPYNFNLPKSIALADTYLNNAINNIQQTLTIQHSDKNEEKLQSLIDTNYFLTPEFSPDILIVDASIPGHENLNWWTNTEKYIIIQIVTTQIELSRWATDNTNKELKKLHEELSTGTCCGYPCHVNITLAEYVIITIDTSTYHTKGLGALSTQTMQLSVPVVHNDYFEALLYNKPIVRRKTVSVNKRFYRSVQLACLRQDRSFNDILIYVRVQLHTKIYSNSGSHQKFVDDLENYYLAATAAYINITARKKKINSMYNDNENKSITIQHIQDLFKGLGAHVLKITGLDDKLSTLMTRLADCSFPELAAILDKASNTIQVLEIDDLNNQMPLYKNNKLLMKTKARHEFNWFRKIIDTSATTLLHLPWAMSQPTDNRLRKSARNNRVLVTCIGSRGDVEPAIATAEEFLNFGMQVDILLPAQYAHLVTNMKLNVIKGTYNTEAALNMWEKLSTSSVASVLDNLKTNDVVLYYDNLEEVTNKDYGVVTGSGLTVFGKFLALSNNAAYVEINAMPWMLDIGKAFGVINKKWLSNNMITISLWHQLSQTMENLGHYMALRDYMNLNYWCLHAIDDIFYSDDTAIQSDAVGMLTTQKDALKEKCQYDIVITYGSMPTTKLINMLNKIKQLFVGNKVLCVGTKLKIFADEHSFDHLPYVDYSLWYQSNNFIALHHGGAGTTQQFLRCGAVQIIYPYAFDQPWFADKIEQLGIGYYLHEHNREQVIRQALTSDFRHKVNELSEELSWTDSSHRLSVELNVRLKIGERKNLILKRCDLRGHKHVTTNSSSIEQEMELIERTDLINVFDFLTLEQQSVVKNIGKVMILSPPLQLNMLCCAEYKQGLDIVIAMTDKVFITIYTNDLKNKQPKAVYWIAKKHTIYTEPMGIYGSVSAPIYGTLPYHAHGCLYFTGNPYDLMANWSTAYGTLDKHQQQLWFALTQQNAKWNKNELTTNTTRQNKVCASLYCDKKSATMKYCGRCVVQAMRYIKALNLEYTTIKELENFIMEKGEFNQLHKGSDINLVMLVNHPIEFTYNIKFTGNKNEVYWTDKQFDGYVICDYIGTYTDYSESQPVTFHAAVVWLHDSDLNCSLPHETAHIVLYIPDNKEAIAEMKADTLIPLHFSTVNFKDVRQVPLATNKDYAVEMTYDDMQFIDSLPVGDPVDTFSKYEKRSVNDMSVSCTCYLECNPRVGCVIGNIDTISYGSTAISKNRKRDIKEAQLGVCNLGDYTFYDAEPPIEISTKEKNLCETCKGNNLLNTVTKAKEIIFNLLEQQKSKNKSGSLEDTKVTDGNDNCELPIDVTHGKNEHVTNVVDEDVSCDQVLSDIVNTTEISQSTSTLDANVDINEENSKENVDITIPTIGASVEVKNDLNETESDVESDYCSIDSHSDDGVNKINNNTNDNRSLELTIDESTVVLDKGKIDYNKNVKMVQSWLKTVTGKSDRLDACDTITKTWHEKGTSAVGNFCGPDAVIRALNDLDVQSDTIVTKEQLIKVILDLLPDDSYFEGAEGKRTDYENFFTVDQIMCGCEMISTKLIIIVCDNKTKHNTLLFNNWLKCTKGPIVLKLFGSHYTYYINQVTNETDNPKISSTLRIYIDESCVNRKLIVPDSITDQIVSRVILDDEHVILVKLSEYEKIIGMKLFEDQINEFSNSLLIFNLKYWLHINELVNTANAIAFINEQWGLFNSHYKLLMNYNKHKSKVGFKFGATEEQMLSEIRHYGYFNPFKSLVVHSNFQIKLKKIKETVATNIIKTTLHEFSNDGNCLVKAVLIYCHKLGCEVDIPTINQMQIRTFSDWHNLFFCLSVLLTKFTILYDGIFYHNEERMTECIYIETGATNHASVVSIDNFKQEAITHLQSYKLTSKYLANEKLVFEHCDCVDCVDNDHTYTYEYLYHKLTTVHAYHMYGEGKQCKLLTHLLNAKRTIMNGNTTAVLKRAQPAVFGPHNSLADAPWYSFYHPDNNCAGAVVALIGTQINYGIVNQINPNYVYSLGKNIEFTHSVLIVKQLQPIYRLLKPVDTSTLLIGSDSAFHKETYEKQQLQTYIHGKSKNIYLSDYSGRKHHFDNLSNALTEFSYDEINIKLDDYKLMHKSWFKFLDNSTPISITFDKEKISWELNIDNFTKHKTLMVTFMNDLTPFDKSPFECLTHELIINDHFKIFIDAWAKICIANDNSWNTIVDMNTTITAPELIMYALEAYGYSDPKETYIWGNYIDTQIYQSEDHTHDNKEYNAVGMTSFIQSGAIIGSCALHRPMNRPSDTVILHKGCMWTPMSTCAVNVVICPSMTKGRIIGDLMHQLLVINDTMVKFTLLPKLVGVVHLDYLPIVEVKHLEKVSLTMRTMEKFKSQQPNNKLHEANSLAQALLEITQLYYSKDNTDQRTYVMDELNAEFLLTTVEFKQWMAKHIGKVTFCRQFAGKTTQSDWHIHNNVTYQVTSNSINIIFFGVQWKITLLKLGGKLWSANLEASQQMESSSDTMYHTYFDDRRHDRSEFRGFQSWQHSAQIIHKNSNESLKTNQELSYKDSKVRGIEAINSFTDNPDSNSVFSALEINKSTGLMQADAVFLPNLKEQLPSSATGLCASELDLPVELVNIWLDRDFSDLNTKIAPLTGEIKSKLEADRIITLNKTILTKYPEVSKPVLTKAANAEFNAVSSRLHSVITLRTEDLNIQEELNRLAKVYFRKDYDQLYNKYANDKLFFDELKTREYIVSRPGWTSIDTQTVMFLFEGLKVHPINKINVHVKLESLTKEDEWLDSMKRMKTRIIVWQPKHIVAVFQPIFQGAKDRLKSLLDSKFHYTDGYTPQEISNLVRLHCDQHSWFFEDDLSKQDRQTDMPLINIEMALYKKLGVHPDVLELWQETHKHWRYKGKDTGGNLHAMRLTGQATTALGNYITNMVVHSRLLETNLSHLLLVLGLGDDFFCISKRKIDAENQSRISKAYYNMQSKARHSFVSGTFLRLIAYKNDDLGAGLGPDFRRLRRRFEVTSGVAKVTDNNLLARVQSYCNMLGNTAQTVKINKSTGADTVLTNWYAREPLIESTADFYKCSTMDIENDWNLLIKMMELEFIEVKGWDVLSYPTPPRGKN